MGSGREFRSLMARWGVLAVALGVLIVDRIAAWWMVTHLVPGEIVPVLPPILMLTLVENSGAAFGLLRHRELLFVVVAVLVLVGGLVAVVRLPKISTRVGLALGLVMGGSAGNLWDRLLNGRVVDYIQLVIPPIFNLADSAIVIGMALLLWEAWHREPKDEDART